MDNRERYKKYRESQSGHPGSTRQSSSTLTTKLKSIFKPWNKSNSNEGEISFSGSNTSHSTKSSQLEPKFLGSPTFKLPGSFYNSQPEEVFPHAAKLPQQQQQQQQQQQHPAPVQQASLIHSPSNVADKEETADNPNDILSAFFREKGDSKLTDVEYEGVIALMSKSKMGTPYKRPMTEMSFTAEEPSFKKRHVGNDSTMVGNSTSIIGSTPSRPKAFKMSGNTTINAPGYTPRYSKVYNDTFDRSYSLINNTTRGSIGSSSSRRVISRSRRPAPYKSRINTSILSHAAGDEKSARDDNTSNIHIINANSDKSHNSKSPSKAAQTLLDILDGKDKIDGTVKDNQPHQNEKLKLFINPYGSGSERRQKKGPGGVSQTPGVTASTIGKTISYSKADPLPKEFEPAGNTIPESFTDDSKGKEASGQASTEEEFSKTSKPISLNGVTNVKDNHVSSTTTSTTNPFGTINSHIPASFTFGKKDQSDIGDSQKNVRSTKGELHVNFSNGGGSNPVDSNSQVETTQPLSKIFQSNGSKANTTGERAFKQNPVANSSNDKAQTSKPNNLFFGNIETSTTESTSQSDAKERGDFTNLTNGSSQEDSTPSKFYFPSPQLVTYDFDDAEVDKYKSVFSF
ncbi:hypothetical protein KGF57_001877 [Candida theae]|uniref:Nucleoporin NUP60 n=1 Tax=Candida theae TaxID=1198502 RepID=A0AAD5FZH1_9ASCO|nr:uncharacterized protein KGF57_001877 [Candida theae]KAI5960730.1 hypothetical protein KGF57_001877 [Candida theae]